MQNSTEQNQPRTITDKDIVGLKYFDQLGQLLQQLHQVGCERDLRWGRSLNPFPCLTPNDSSPSSNRSAKS